VESPPSLRLSFESFPASRSRRRTTWADVNSRICSPSSRRWTSRSERQSRGFTTPSSGRVRTTAYRDSAGSSRWPPTTSEPPTGPGTSRSLRVVRPPWRRL